MLSLRVALQRVAQDGVDETSGELCDQCGRMPASKRCPLGALCVVCSATARARAWRKRRACIAQLRKVGPVLLILGVGSASAAARVHDGDTLAVDCTSKDSRIADSSCSAYSRRAPQPYRPGPHGALPRALSSGDAARSFGSAARSCGPHSASRLEEQACPFGCGASAFPVSPREPLRKCSTAS